jgi:hypothetical protein
MSQAEVKRYSYKGSVCEFGRCIANIWTAETTATSKKKALSNLAFQFKRDNNKIKTAKITLDPSKLVVVE